MTRAIRIHQTGGPEVLQWEQITVGEPGPGQVRLQQTACGLNYIDVYGRSGMYPVGDLPAVIGMEGVGRVDAIGDGVDGLCAGDRVAYPMNLGAYAEQRLIDTQQQLRRDRVAGKAVNAGSLLRLQTVLAQLRSRVNGFDADGIAKTVGMGVQDREGLIEPTVLLRGELDRPAQK